MKKTLVWILSLLMSASFAFGCFFAFNNKTANLPTSTPPAISDDTTIATASGDWLDTVKDAVGVPIDAGIEWVDPNQNKITISNGKGLAYFAKLVNDAVDGSSMDSALSAEVYLKNDIDLSAHNWTPIKGTSTRNFYGTFNGEGYTISGLTIGFAEKRGDSFGGLFGVCGGAKFEDLTIKGTITKLFDSKSGIYGSFTNIALGGIVGAAQLDGSGVREFRRYGAIEFTNCKNYVNIDLGIDNSRYHPACYVGGFVGWTLNGYAKFNNCINEGKLTYSKWQTCEDTLEKWNMAVNSSIMPNQLFMGGMAGLMTLRQVLYSKNGKSSTYSSNNLTLAENCINYGVIDISYTAKEDEGDKKFYDFFLRFGAGGLFGGILTSSTAYNKNLAGAIAFDKRFEDDLKIVSCANKGNIKIYAKNSTSIGRLAFTNMYFEYRNGGDSYNYVANNDIVFTAGVGGIVGTFFSPQSPKFRPESAKITITNCINFADISVKNCAGYVQDGIIRIFLYNIYATSCKVIYIYFTPPQIGGILGYVEDLDDTSENYVLYTNTACLNFGDITFFVDTWNSNIDGNTGDGVLIGRVAYGANGIGPSRNHDDNHAFKNEYCVNYGDIITHCYSIINHIEMAKFNKGVGGSSWDDETYNINFGQIKHNIYKFFQGWTEITVNNDYLPYKCTQDDIKKTTDYQSVLSHENWSDGNSYTICKNPIYKKNGKDVYVAPGTLLAKGSFNFYNEEKSDGNRLNVDNGCKVSYSTNSWGEDRSSLNSQHMFYLKDYTSYTSCSYIVAEFNSTKYVLKSYSTSVNRIFLSERERTNSSSGGGGILNPVNQTTKIAKKPIQPINPFIGDYIEGLYNLVCSLSTMPSKGFDIDIILTVNLPTYRDVQFFYSHDGDSYNSINIEAAQNMGYEDDDTKLQDFCIDLSYTAQNNQTVTVGGCNAYDQSWKSYKLETAAEKYHLDIGTAIGYYVSKVMVSSATNIGGQVIWENNEDELTYGEQNVELTKSGAKKFFNSANTYIKVYYKLAPITVKFDITISEGVEKGSGEQINFAIVEGNNNFKEYNLYNSISSDSNRNPIIKAEHKYGYMWNFSMKDEGTINSIPVTFFVDVPLENTIKDSDSYQARTAVFYEYIVREQDGLLYNFYVTQGVNENEIKQKIKETKEVTVTVSRTPIKLTANYKAMSNKLTEDGVSDYIEDAVGGKVSGAKELTEAARYIPLEVFLSQNRGYLPTGAAMYQIGDYRYDTTLSNANKKHDLYDVYNSDITVQGIWDNIFANKSNTEICEGVAANLASTVDIYAYFALQQYTLNVQTNRKDNVSVEKSEGVNNGPTLNVPEFNKLVSEEGYFAQIKVYYGQKVKLTVTADISSERFLGWYYTKNNTPQLQSAILLGVEKTFEFSYLYNVEENKVIEILADFKKYVDTGKVLTKNSKGIYEVSSAEDLQTLAKMVAEGNNFKGWIVRQTADIDLTDVDLMPIGVKGAQFGDANRPFSGIYDGNYFKIKNFSATLNTQENVGLFGYTDGATIKNLVVEHFNIIGLNNVGMVVGYAKNTKFKNVLTQDCNMTVNSITCRRIRTAQFRVYKLSMIGFTFYDDLREDSVGFYIDHGYAGLFVAHADGCFFEGCYATGLCYSEGREVTLVGGFIGQAKDCALDQCYSGASLNGSMYKKLDLILEGKDVCAITDCYDATGFAITTNTDNWILITNANGRKVKVLKIFYWAE